MGGAGFFPGESPGHLAEVAREEGQRGCRLLQRCWPGPVPRSGQLLLQDGQRGCKGGGGSCPCPVSRQACLASLSEPHSAGFSMGHRGLAQKGDCPSSTLVQGSFCT